MYHNPRVQVRTPWISVLQQRTMLPLAWFNQHLPLLINDASDDRTREATKWENHSLFILRLVHILD